MHDLKITLDYPPIVLLNKIRLYNKTGKKKRAQKSTLNFGGPQQLANQYLVWGCMKIRGSGTLFFKILKKKKLNIN